MSTKQEEGKEERDCNHAWQMTEEIRGSTITWEFRCVKCGRAATTVGEVLNDEG